MDKREAARVLARGRGAEKHRAETSAEEHGLLVADHRVSRRTGRGHSVICVPSFRWKTTSGHLKARMEAE